MASIQLPPLQKQIKMDGLRSADRADNSAEKQTNGRRKTEFSLDQKAVSAVDEVPDEPEV